MADIEFEEEESIIPKRPQIAHTPTPLERVLMRTGLVHNSTWANIVLVLIMVACFSLSIYILRNYFF